MDVGRFTSGVIGVVVGLLVVTSVALPTITTAIAGLDAEKDASIIAMLNVLPLLLVVSIVLAVIGMFIFRGRGE